MNLIHEKVTHKRFGAGSVMEFDGHILTVFFDAYGYRLFSYPSAFENFLKADNPDIQAEALAEIRARRELNESAVVRAEKHIEELRPVAPARRRTSAAKPAKTVKTRKKTASPV